MTLHAVSPEDSVQVTPEVIHAERDTIVEFNCSALGGPGNNFIWFRMLDDEVVGSNPVLQVGVEGAFAGGVYECLVENDAGSDIAVVTLNGTAYPIVLLRQFAIILSMYIIIYLFSCTSTPCGTLCYECYPL